jgi:hypothetical protein
LPAGSGDADRLIAEALARRYARSNHCENRHRDDDGEDD